MQKRTIGVAFPVNVDNVRLVLKEVYFVCNATGQEKPRAFNALPGQSNF